MAQKTQAQINADRVRLDAIWKAKDIERTNRLLQSEVNRTLKQQTKVIDQKQQAAFIALQKENNLSVANYKNSAIIDQLNAAKADVQTFAAVNDVVKATSIGVGAGRAQQANAGFTVDTGTALDVSLQQSIEGAFQQMQAVETGGKVSQTLSQAANEKVTAANRLKSDFSFISASLKPKNPNTNSFTFNS